MEDERLEQRLEDELRALEAARATDRAAERRNATVNRIVAGSLLAIVGVFAVVNYRHFASAWTEEKLTASLRSELDAINVTAMGELGALGEHLVPVYANEGLRQLEELSPEIARRFGEQLERIGTDLQAEARAQLFETEDRIRERTTELAIEAFPELGTPQELERLEQRVHQITDEAVTDALAQFDARFAGDVDELQGVVMSFDVTDTDEPTVDLQKRFLHCWLQLLDKEIQKL